MTDSARVRCCSELSAVKNFLAAVVKARLVSRNAARALWWKSSSAATSLSDVVGVSSHRERIDCAAAEYSLTKASQLGRCLGCKSSLASVNAILALKSASSSAQNIRMIPATDGKPPRGGAGSAPA